MSEGFFDGDTYQHSKDFKRLKKQHERVKDLMLDGVWRTLEEISESINAPSSSVSAQLRHLRKARFGSYIVHKRTRGHRNTGLYEYQVEKPKDETT